MPPASSPLSDILRQAAPTLFGQVDALASKWLASLVDNPKATGPSQDKHINDPVWGTITLYPWEVALLDTMLVQRLRGIKQLGLAYLVFPTATHDRFSHACGVVEATDRMVEHIERNAKARRRCRPSEHAPGPIDEADRYLVRLAALIHDIGHGPFSHAIEPVVARVFETDIRAIEIALRQQFPRTETVQVSEAIAVLVVASEAFQILLDRPLMDLPRKGRSRDYVTRAIVRAIVGGSNGSQHGALSSLVSGQIDADKLDYMARDAHHAGLPIDFDSERLITKLELLYVDEPALSERLYKLKQRIKDHGTYYEVGIAAGGTGAFEQMLIGRIFLYDRLYHHHKVRAADAMAQRLVHYADPDRTALTLQLLYAPIPDDTIVRAFGGMDINVGDAASPLTYPSTSASKEIAEAIISRSLYKRAFAFAGRFVAGIDTDAANGEGPARWSEEEKDAERSRVMDKVNREIVDFNSRLAAEKEIAELAMSIGQSMPDGHPLKIEATGLSPHHVIVDLPRDPHPARIKTIARNDDGRLDVPDVFYDPARWADVYSAQRRTGYVFAHPDRRALVALASRLWFFRRFGCVLGDAADRQAKSSQLVEKGWYEALHNGGLITERERSYLERPRVVHVPFALKPMHVPSSWEETQPGFAADFNRQFNAILPEGISAPAENELVQTLRGIFAVVQTWSKDSDFTRREILDERTLQKVLREALRLRDLEITEGAETGGGESDLISGKRVIIENKIIRDPTDDPFGALPKTALQARRYVLPTNQPFVITAVAYKAASEAGFLPSPKCVRLQKVDGVDGAFLEIRVAIRHSDSKPSAAG
jgi:HD superfamily phosphohydrolase